MTEMLGTIATILAVVGVLFNNRKMIICFPLWFISSAICLWLHYGVEMWSQVARDVIFMFLFVDGMIKWSKKKGKK